MSFSGKKMEGGVEIKAPADSYHDVISSKQYKVASMWPEFVQSVDLIKGNWGQKGSIISWSYLLGGAPQECKEVIEEIDDSNKSTTFKVIEGDILNSYKSMKLVVQATPKSQGTSQVNWTIIYEKLNEDVADPNPIMDLLINETEAVAANLMQANA